MRLAAGAFLFAAAFAQLPAPEIDSFEDQLALFQLRAERLVHSQRTPTTVLDDNASTLGHLHPAPAPDSSASLGNSSLGQITAYIQFGKVGSSSIRNLLEHRAEVHGWPVVDEDATCKKHRVTGEECEKKKALECKTAQEQGLPCGKRLCLARENLPSSTGQPDCADEPTDSVVQVTNPGFCEALQGSRPCSYITLLREPISRMVSEYNYWCLDCKDHVNHQGIFCLKGYHCPDSLSITDWARRHGNDYTRRLATRTGSEHLADNFYADTGFLSSELTEADFQAALSVLQADNMLVLWIEELQEGANGKPSGLHQLSEFLADNTVLDQVPMDKNRHEHTYQPTAKELKELKEILHYDIRLYEALHA